MIDLAVASVAPSRVEHVVFPERFQGPPGMANGGIVAGTLAARLGGAVEVTLSRPAPLARPLPLSITGPEAALGDGELVVATARRAPLGLDVPPPISYAAAVAASARFRHDLPHPFPRCFVCGSARARHDALRLLPGPTDDGTVVAAPWRPDADLCRDVAGGDVRDVPAPLVWAALDCPGAWSLSLAPGPATLPKMVLGRITGVQHRPLSVGAPHVVLGWRIGQERRKYFCGTAVYDDHGELAASAQSTWITLA
jgi:hypothetical protein